MDHRVHRDEMSGLASDAFQTSRYEYLERSVIDHRMSYAREEMTAIAEEEKAAADKKAKAMKARRRWRLERGHELPTNRWTKDRLFRWLRTYFPEDCPESAIHHPSRRDVKGWSADKVTELALEKRLLIETEHAERLAEEQAEAERLAREADAAAARLMRLAAAEAARLRAAEAASKAAAEAARLAKEAKEAAERARQEMMQIAAATKVAHELGGQVEARAIGKKKAERLAAEAAAAALQRLPCGGSREAALRQLPGGGRGPTAPMSSGAAYGASLLSIAPAAAASLRRASAEIRADKTVVLAVVGVDGGGLEHASASLQDDKEVVLAAVAQNGWALQHASAVLQHDKEVVLAAVEQHGLALYHVPPQLRSDRDVVLAAVAPLGRATEYASAELKDEVGSGRALEYASAELKNDPHVVMTAVAQPCSKDHAPSLRHASELLRSVKSVVLAAVRESAIPPMFSFCVAVAVAAVLLLLRERAPRDFAAHRCIGFSSLTTSSMRCEGGRGRPGLAVRPPPPDSRDDMQVD